MTRQNRQQRQQANHDDYSNVVEMETLLPPHSSEAEQAVLGGILFSPDVMNDVIEFLRPEHFYRTAHRYIFQAMYDLAEMGEPIDTVYVSERMSDTGTLDAGGGRPYLMDLAMSVATAANTPYHAKIIYKKALMRELITAGNEIASACYEMTDPDEAIDMAQRLVLDIAQNGIQEDSKSLGQIMPQVMDGVKERQENAGTLMGLSTGFYDLDTYTSGLQKSDLIILAARPSMGKTACCLNIATHVALREKKPVLFFSLEMSADQLGLRMICSEAELDTQKIRAGTLSEYDMPKLMTAMGTLGDAPVFIDDKPALTVMEMRAKARKKQKEIGALGLIIVDYLQLMGTTGSEDNRVQEITAITRGLKSLARELKVPVIALSQLSRAVESRQDKRPMLSDLRESGSIEQDADVVMFIYRDEYYNKQSERPGTADIIIAKQRNGPVGEISLLFRHNTTRFMNPSDRRTHVF